MRVKKDLLISLTNTFEMQENLKRLLKEQRSQFFAECPQALGHAYCYFLGCDTDVCFKRKKVLKMNAVETDNSQDFQILKKTITEGRTLLE